MTDTTNAPRRGALIPGGNGLLARCMKARLTASGWRVTAPTRAELDITREADVQRLVEQMQPEVIINCASTGDVDRCEREPEWAFAVNEAGPRHLARAARAFSAEMIHVSTDYVFDGAKAGFYTQEDEPRPESVYGQSKLAGERAVRAECEQSYILRTSWLFGAGGKNFGSRVLEYARTVPRLKGVIDQTSIPTYAPDMAVRIEEILARKTYGLYHVTSTGVTTWYEFARLALDLAGLKDYEIEPVTRAALNQVAPRPHNSAMRCLLSEQLGLAPLRHWRDTMREFISEQLTQPGV
jgi:dTDP-4-dehydrorhamnose reductase